MATRSLVLSSFAFILGAAAASARGDLAQEYEQVHKIALRDARVRDAFARANERLDARIVEIDPTLAGYVHAHPSGRGEPAAPAAAGVARQPFVPAAKPKPKAPPAPAPAAAAGQRTHVVAPGETLSAIATQYGVTVKSLETANSITDARKLRAGQTLLVP